MVTVLRGDVQAVVLAGGLARSEMIVNWLRERVEWIAPMLVLPGQYEMAALSDGALRLLRGEEAALEY